MKGASPLFSRQSIRKSLIIVTAVLAIGVPVFQFTGNSVQGADPTYSVMIVDYNFLPAKVNITTGTTVVWTYISTGKDFHTVTSDPGTNKTQSGAALLNSGSMSPGQTFSYTFYQPGYYPYQCSFHPALMYASVNVTGSPVTPPPAPQNTPDYTLIATVGGVVGVIVVATVALFLRRKHRPPATPTVN